MKRIINGIIFLIIIINSFTYAQNIRLKQIKDWKDTLYNKTQTDSLVKKLVNDSLSAINTDSSNVKSIVSDTAITLRDSLSQHRNEIDSIETRTNFIANIKNYIPSTIPDSVLGSGASHPLSNYYASIAAAQLDFSFVYSLDHELDWAIIQKALNDIDTDNETSQHPRAKVLIPYGIYIIDTTIIIPQHGHIEGEGTYNTTRLKLKAGSNCNLLETYNYIDHNDWMHAFSIVNIRLEGNKDNNTSGSGLCIYEMGETGLVDRVNAVEFPDYGIKVDGVNAGGIFENLSLFNNDSAGIYFQGGDGGTGLSADSGNIGTVTIYNISGDFNTLLKIKGNGNCNVFGWKSEGAVDKEIYLKTNISNLGLVGYQTLKLAIYGGNHNSYAVGGGSATTRNFIFIDQSNTKPSILINNFTFNDVTNIVRDSTRDISKTTSEYAASGWGIKGNFEYGTDSYLSNLTVDNLTINNPSSIDTQQVNDHLMVGSYVNQNGLVEINNSDSSRNAMVINGGIYLSGGSLLRLQSDNARTYWNYAPDILLKNYKAEDNIFTSIVNFSYTSQPTAGIVFHSYNQNKQGGISLKTSNYLGAISTFLFDSTGNLTVPKKVISDTLEVAYENNSTGRKSTPNWPNYSEDSARTRLNKIDTLLCALGISPDASIGPGSYSGTFCLPYDITIKRARVVLITDGGANDTLWGNIKFSTDRSSGSPSTVWSSDKVWTNTTTGQTITSFNDATIPKESWIWLSITSASGTVIQINVTLIGRTD